MEKLAEISEEYGMRMNVRKTKTMAISKSGHIQTTIKVQNVLQNVLLGPPVA